MERVAVIGAGPGGIVVGRYLAGEGYEPVIFESSDAIGGQWHTDNPLSGVWRGMVTNTSREMTHFSDLGWPGDTPAFPAAVTVRQYLEDYARQFDLQRRIHLNCPVVELRRKGSGYSLSTGESSGEQKFDKVVVATGRFNHPVIPDIPGLGAAGMPVHHSFDFDDPSAYAGQNVLVAGGAISALEIASDLVQAGAARVGCAMRRQRYVVRKVHDGVPTDHFNFSLSEGLASERLSADELAEELRRFVLDTAGSPDEFGAPAPHSDIRDAGWTKCEDYLELVAAGKILPLPWLRRVDENLVTFEDGQHAAFDAIIMGTGFRLGMPFVDTHIACTLRLDAEHIALHKHTFHPDVPGLAFLGFYNQVGPYFPVLELQARWIAYAFSGKCPPPGDSEMRSGVEACLQSWKQPQKIPMHQLALLFAREIGALPDPGTWPDLLRPLMFGPLAPSLFRLCGPDALTQAPAQLKAAAGAFDMIQDGHLTESERARLVQIGVGQEGGV